MLLITLILCFTSIPANAVWNGTDAVEGNRVIAFYNGPPTEKEQTAATGFLYSPYIVFTVAHAFFGDDRVEVPRYRDIPYSVGLPGAKSGSNAKRILVKKVFIAKNFTNRNMFQDGGTHITRQNDFAVLVLSEKLPLDNKKVFLLTPETHEKMIAEKSTVVLTGYGHQTADSEINPQSPDEKLDRTPKSINIQMYGKQVPIQSLNGVFPFNRYPGRNFTYDQTLNFYIPYGSNTSICSGDSGSPYYIDGGDSITYLGANSSAVGISNCGTMQMATAGGYISGDPVYLYKDLISEAEKYVADNFYATPKVSNSSPSRKFTITCISGKTTKKVSGVNPKCPKGFKLK
jgi:secreted trypsin-like serine protease